MAVPVVKADIKASVKADVTKPIDKLIDAAVEAFSPATEALGFLGDAVRLARVGVAASITRRAKEIADGAGLRLISPPLKFLVPFYEKSSTEEVSDTSLEEMWARLLVAAGSAYTSRHIRYISLLSEMSHAQVKIFDDMIRSHDNKIIALENGFYVSSNIDEKLLRLYFGARRELPIKLLFDMICEELCVAGICIVDVFGMDNEWGTEFRFNDDKIYKREHVIDFQILSSLGLVNHVVTGRMQVDHGYIGAEYYHVTELGYDFWRACSSGQAAEPKRSRRKTARPKSKGAN